MMAVDVDRDWPETFDPGSLEATPEDFEVRDAIVVLNGKPTGFTDVHDGPARYLGRGNTHYNLEASELANPFPLQEHSRLDSLHEYNTWLRERTEADAGFTDTLLDHYGEVCACWCHPKLCHLDVLNWHLVYRLHAGMDPQMAEEQITIRINKTVDRRIAHGIANPADYY